MTISPTLGPPKAPISVAEYRRQVERELAAYQYAHRNDPPTPITPPRAPLPGAVARASIQIRQNFNMPVWFDLFATGEQIGPARGWASFNDAVAAVSQLPGRDGAFGIFETSPVTDFRKVFRAQRLLATDLPDVHADPATAPRVPFDPAAMAAGGDNHARILRGVAMLDGDLRGIVANGGLLPQVGPLG